MSSISDKISLPKLATMKADTNVELNIKNLRDTIAKLSKTVKELISKVNELSED